MGNEIMTSTEATFRTAIAVERGYVCISCAIDAFDAYEPFTRVFIYDEDDQDLWHFYTEECIIIDIGGWRNPVTGLKALITMSDEGEVVFLDDEPVVEKIPGAGVFSEGAKGWGYMRTVRQIGTHLYAVGGAGQVYKRFGRDRWDHMDEGVLQAPAVEDRLLLADIHGLAEDDIYICGGIPGAYGYEGRLYHWDGVSWTPLPVPTTERLTKIYPDDAGMFWICGANGTLLRGDRRQGFIDVSTVDDNQLFTSIARFNDQIYLASNLGLFAFDGKRINEVRTGLTPELQDASVVNAVDGVLWSVGTKDIARFDGRTWERIDFPDNPPIR